MNVTMNNAVLLHLWKKKEKVLILSDRQQASSRIALPMISMNLFSKEMRGSSHSLIENV